MVPGESQAVIIGREYDGLDYLRAELACLRQPAQVDLLAEAVPPMFGKDSRDHCRRRRARGRRPDSRAAPCCSVEIGNLKVVALRTRNDLVGRQRIGGDDQVVDALPVMQGSPATRRLDLLEVKTGH